MYETPIKMIMAETEYMMEDEVFKAIQRCAIDVDKEELIKALQYDRDQYNKGYQDGLSADKWVLCSERLPNKDEYLKNDGRFIVTDGNRVYQSVFDIYEGLFMKFILTFADEDKCVIAWQPLPEPYKEDKA